MKSRLKRTKVFKGRIPGRGIDKAFVHWPLNKITKVTIHTQTHAHGDRPREREKKIDKRHTRKKYV